jgi:flagellar hook-length control protein FliK
MNASDLGFLGPARQARAEASRDARLTRDEAPRPAPDEDFASLMRPEGSPSKSSPKPTRATNASGETPAASDQSAEPAPAPPEGEDNAATRSRAAEPEGTVAADPAPEVASDAAPEPVIPPAVMTVAREPAPSAATDAEPVDPSDLPALETTAEEGAGIAEGPPTEAAPALSVPAEEAVAPAASDPAASDQIAGVAPRPERRAPAASAAASGTPRTEVSDAEPRGSDAPVAPEGATRTDVDVARTKHMASVLEVDPGQIAQDGADPLPFALTRSGEGGADWRLLPGAPTQGAEPARAAIDPRAVLGQITVALAAGDTSRVEIRLDPAELGRVHIALSRTERGLHASVTAERPETMDLLRRNADVLTRELAAAGYDTVSLDMAQGGQDPEAGARSGGGRAEIYAAPGVAPDTSSAAAVSPSPAPASRSGIGPLDIRL